MWLWGRYHVPQNVFLVINDLVYEAKAKTFFLKSKANDMKKLRPTSRLTETVTITKYELKFALQ